MDIYQVNKIYLEIFAKLSWRLQVLFKFWKLKYEKQGVGGPLGPLPPQWSPFIGQSSGIIPTTQHKLQLFSWLSLYFFLYVKDHFWYKWIRELKPKTFVSWTLLYFTTMLDLLLSHSILWILYYYYYYYYYSTTTTTTTTTTVSSLPLMTDCKYRKETLCWKYICMLRRFHQVYFVSVAALTIISLLTSYSSNGAKIKEDE